MPNPYDNFRGSNSHWHEIIIRSDPNRRVTFTPGTLQMGHWVRVTIYRFYDWRHEAMKGVSNMSNISGEIAERGYMSGIDHEAALPLYGTDGSADAEPNPNSARALGVDTPLRVRTIGTRDETAEAGDQSRTELVGTVTRMTAQKQLRQASGRFNLQAKMFGEWTGDDQPVDALNPLGLDNTIHKYVDSGDWLEIEVVKSDPRVENTVVRTVMIGRVDSVSVNMTALAQGSGGTMVTIEGRDVGCVYEDLPLYFNPYDEAHNNALGLQMAKMIHDIGGSPDELVLSLLGLVANEQATYGLPPVLPDAGLWTQRGKDTIKWIDCIDITRVTPMRGIIHSPSLLTPGQYTPLWQFTQTYGVPEMNEWFMDIESRASEQARFAMLTGREKPFVNVFDAEDSNWWAVPTCIVHLQEIKATTLRRGGERYNHINLIGQLPANISQDAVAYCKPSANFHSILRWGLKKLDVTVALHSVEEDSAEEALYADLKEYRDIVICWNVLNPYYWTGTITIVGLRPDIRVGKKILIEGGPQPEFAEGPLTEVGEGYVPDTQTASGLGGSFYAAYTGGGYTDLPVVGEMGTATTFYVEAVNYTWSAGASPTAETVVTVSRGYQDNLRLPHIKALYELWEDTTAIDGSQVPRPTLDASRYDSLYDLKDGIFVT